MKKLLLIDDMTERHEGLKEEYCREYVIDHAFNYEEACSYLDQNSYDLICFDHDLNDFSNEGERTGSSVARYMAYNGMTSSQVRVHSHNPVGAKNILSIIKSGDISDNYYYEPFQVIKGADMIGLKKEVKNIK